MARKLLRVVDLQKSYRVGDKQVTVLRGISFEIAAGEFVAIMGPSGSGKSTLLTLLGSLDRPSAGQYLFDGRDVGGLDEDRRAMLRNRKIGFVFQVFNLLQRNSARDNVELPLQYAGVARSERHRRAAAALGSVGLSHRAHHRPQQLSGGEQQRVAIARAIVSDPDLILADEPTGALDRQNGDDVMALLSALNAGGRTLVLVTHDHRVARNADRILHIQDGRLIDVDPLADTQSAR